MPRRNCTHPGCANRSTAPNGVDMCGAHHQASLIESGEIDYWLCLNHEGSNDDPHPKVSVDRVKCHVCKSTRAKWGDPVNRRVVHQQQPLHDDDVGGDVAPDVGGLGIFNEHYNDDSGADDDDDDDDAGGDFAPDLEEVNVVFNDNEHQQPLDLDGDDAGSNFDPIADDASINNIKISRKVKLVLAILVVSILNR